MTTAEYVRRIEAMTITVRIKIGDRHKTQHIRIENPNQIPGGARWYATEDEGIKMHYRRHRDKAETTAKFLTEMGIPTKIEVSYTTEPIAPLPEAVNPLTNERF